MQPTRIRALIAALEKAETEAAEIEAAEIEAYQLGLLQDDDPVDQQDAAYLKNLAIAARATAGAGGMI